MAMNISEIISDLYILREGFICREGYVFTCGSRNPTVFDRLVVRKPFRARANEQRLGYSEKSLEEHINLICSSKIEKVMLICDNLEFLKQCPSITDVQVFPSYEADANFDFSPLYSLPNLKVIECKTRYGSESQYLSSIDYSRFSKLESVALTGDGHIGFSQLQSLDEIWISENKKVHSFSDISTSPKLRKATILQCGIRSLSGIERCSGINSLLLYNNRRLEDISSIKVIASSLTELAIENCGKIVDFSVLASLENLEHLHLYGNNTLDDLSFLQNMKKLKTFSFTMNVKDGDLSPCLQIPYATCKNRKHYNMKDSDLPK